MRGLLSLLLRARTTGRESPTYRAILDLGTSQTKALVVRADGRESVILGAAAAPHEASVSSTSGGPMDVLAMVRSCDRALRQAEEMTARCCGSQVVPDWVVLGVPNCLTAFLTHTVTHRRSEAGRRVTERELGDVVQRAQRLALQELGDNVNPRLGCPEGNLELLESGVAGVKVDGHGVTTPVGLHGETITVTVFNVVVPAPYRILLRTVASELGLEILDVMSSWQALASAIPDRRAVCIDVGGSGTDIVLVHSSRAWDTARVPLGGLGFTAQIARAFRLSRSDAERCKLAYSLGQLDAGLEERLRAALDEVLAEWLRELEKALTPLCGSEGLPRQIVLCGGGSSLPGIVESVGDHPWMSRLNCSGDPEVRAMLPERVPGILDGTAQLRDAQYACAVALAAYATGGAAHSAVWERFLSAVKRPDVLADSGVGT
ncbi:MAG TPA: cell division FtsA domain-containing protein [Anaerolineae bacterium]|nr:cell division FtsA domain-containing protein [Anaerolineae bacterium]